LTQFLQSGVGALLDQAAKLIGMGRQTGWRRATDTRLDRTGLASSLLEAANP
jgi:hypothetical protein